MSEEDLTIYRERIEDEIRSLIDGYFRKEEYSLHIINEYYRDLREFVLRGGKRLRPLCVIYAYKGVTGQDNPEIFRVSTCVELLHNSSLIHDDIIDRDVLRRGKPTFHEIYRSKYLKLHDSPRDAELHGESVAILGGDTLFNMGLDAIVKSGFPAESKVKAVNIYTMAYMKLIEGQLLDITYEKTFELTEKDYLKMIKLKTAWLFYASVMIGCLLGKASTDQIKTLTDYVFPMAMAFQIHDDILGSFGKVKETGKAADSDIKQGKRTLLVIYAFKNGTEEHRETLMKYLGVPDLEDEQVDMVRRVFVESKALEKAEAKKEAFVKEAKKALEKGKKLLSEDSYGFFSFLSRFVGERTY